MKSELKSKTQAEEYIPQYIQKEIEKPGGKIDLEALTSLEKTKFRFQICQCLAGYSIFHSSQAQLMHMKELICDFNSQEYYEKSNKLSRALGSFLSLAIGDSFGHIFQFLPFQSESGVLESLTESGFKKAMGSTLHCNQFRIKPGQWTDDTSMALCLADCLLTNGKVD